MTEEGMDPDDILLELTRNSAVRYRRLAECSRLLEDAQLRLISMMESGTVGRDVLRREKDRIEDMKREISILTKEAEEADSQLREFKEKIVRTKLDNLLKNLRISLKIIIFVV